MRVLVACEKSQAVCVEFRKMGHEAYSCDILPCSGGHPEWHIMGDVLAVLGGGKFYTEDGVEHFVEKWDMMIAFPPCTHLAVSGAAWFEEKRKDGRQQAGIDFFMAMINAPVEMICVENLVGIMSGIYRKPDQVIQPYYFGDEFQKTTCLWLKNLPKLYHNGEVNLFDRNVTHVGKGDFFEWVDGKTNKKKRQPLWFKEARDFPKDRGKIRSKTFPGIARAMAEQWG